jgi:hypothetical protein
MPQTSRLERALARIDAANAEDPNTELASGKRRPKEVLYAERMTACLHRLEPEPSEALQLAVRAQHLRRWTLPRASHPAGRRGYLAWRRACQEMHAQQAAAILREAGYSAATVERVGDLILKRRIKSDPEAQTVEDAACLVFLDSVLAGFAAKHDEAKLVAILRKTWRKMSPRAQLIALGMDLPKPLRALVELALDSTEEREEV